MSSATWTITCRTPAHSAGACQTGQMLLRRDGDTLSGVFTQAAFLNERQLPVPLGSIRFTRIED